MGSIRQSTGVKDTREYRRAGYPGDAGERFADHILGLFPPDSFAIERDAGSDSACGTRHTVKGPYPDYLVRYVPTGERFGIVCRYRSDFGRDEVLEWSTSKHLHGLRRFATEENNPVFIIIGLEMGAEKSDAEPSVFNIPLTEAKSPKIYPAFFERYRRPYGMPFVWKNGVLY
jgi:hypothetical protein